VRERRSGEFSRSFRLPDVVDEEGSEAAYEHGVLTVSFPKQEAKRSKELEVKVKSQAVPPPGRSTDGQRVRRQVRRALCVEVALRSHRRGRTWYNPYSQEDGR